ncbi:MAG: hypothetical protein ACOH5I_26250 [Oligoflexus sp.]
MKYSERPLKLTVRMFDMLIFIGIFILLIPKSMADLQSTDFLIFIVPDNFFDKAYGFVVVWFFVRFWNFFLSHPRANKAIDRIERQERAPTKTI